MGKLIHHTVTVTITETWTITWTEAAPADVEPQPPATTVVQEQIVQEQVKAPAEPDVVGPTPKTAGETSAIEGTATATTPAPVPDAPPDGMTTRPNADKRGKRVHNRRAKKENRSK